MSLYPYAGAHAVQSAAFAFEWAPELNETDLSAIASTHEQLRSSLPAVAPVQTLIFQMSGGQPTSTSNAAAGYVFSRPGHTGPARALEVQRNRIVGQVNDYTRWAPVWKEVLGWFSIVGPVLGKRRITHVGLQYNDVFHWRDAPHSLDLKTVFREDSKLLPKNIFELQGLWHSHHGYFLELNDPLPHKLLENVNVNLVEELGQRSIVISTVHKAEIPNIWNWDDLAKIIEPLMEGMHKRNKKTLGDLLSPAVAQSISLFKGDK